MGDESDLNIPLQIIMCTIGTLAFAITMKAPRKTIFFIFIGALLSATAERLLSVYTNDFLSCLTAMTMLSLYCEAISRVIKEPTTVTLMPSTIPLLPGSSIYYTMLYAINGSKEMIISYGTSTLFAGLGIALGAVISSLIVKIFFSIKRH